MFLNYTEKEWEKQYTNTHGHSIMELLLFSFCYRNISSYKKSKRSTDFHQNKVLKSRGWEGPKTRNIKRFVAKYPETDI